MTPKLTNRRRRVIGAIILGVLCYVVSFVWLRYLYLPLYEIEHLLERHPLQSAYAVTYYPLRWFAANDWSPIPRRARVTVGTLTKVEPRSLKFAYGGEFLSVGFVCEPAVCSTLDQVRPGDQVEAKFGSALVSGNDGFINELLSIRVCASHDTACESALKKQESERQEQEHRFQLSEKKLNECLEKMKQTLQLDSRYLASPSLGTHDDSKTTAERFNSLVGEQKACAHALLESHRKSVFESCEKHRCGDSIGGGCSHMTGLVHVEAIARAVQKCGA
jgi:hypothetical protein